VANRKKGTKGSLYVGKLGGDLLRIKRFVEKREVACYLRVKNQIVFTGRY